MKRTLSDFSVLTFDCYGTLIDWETGIWDALQPLILSSGTSPNRESVLNEYAQIEHALEAENPSAPYNELLGRVHARLAASWQTASTAELDGAFAESVQHGPAFADTAEALRSLRDRYKLVILSNVHRRGIAASIRKLGVDFDAVYTAEDIGAYKPADANFEYLLRHLNDDFGLQRADVLHTAQSLFHDHVPANRFGIASAWIDRQRLSDGGSWGATASVEELPSVDFRYYSLGEMAAAVKRT